MVQGAAGRGEASCWAGSESLTDNPDVWDGTGDVGVPGRAAQPSWERWWGCQESVLEGVASESCLQRWT